MELEERSRVGTEEFCGLRGSCCGGLKGSLCGGCSIDVKSHMQIFLDTIIDVRRMYKSMYIYKSSHALPQNVVDELYRPLDFVSTSAEAVVTQMLARSAEAVVTRKHKSVRFNDNSNDDNSK